MNMNVDMPSDVESYGIEECPSDEERAASSSEDELEVLLNGTPDQKRKLIREYLTGESESSSGDEFEKEMNAELNSTIRTMEGSWGATATRTAEPVGQAIVPVGQTNDPVPPTLYDDVYFDSDSEEETGPTSSTGKRRSQRRILTNDELLYDPDEDDRDQAWVDAKRREYSGKRAKLCKESVQNLSSSDAVLNCPSCMITLCLDCQRHERYRSQYRAMFVLNCSVNTAEMLRYKTQNHRRNRNRKRKNTPAASTTTTTTTSGASTSEAATTTTTAAVLDSEEVYHPVLCTECSTEVAVFDKDEVYHFFNILASHC